MAEPAHSYDVFISYSRRDARAAAMIRRKLNALGLSVFSDSEGIEGGADFPDIIDRAVKSAKVVLACWTHEAVERPWVRIECRIGLDRGTLVAAAIEPMRLSDLPAEFYNVNVIDLADFDGGDDHPGWQSIMRAIGRRTGRVDPAGAKVAGHAAVVGQPPLVLVSAFNDDAIRATHPHCASELREEVLSGLARFREIRLVAENVLRRSGGYGRASDRDYQLTATLLPEGDGVKVIARAKRLDDGRIVWAETMSLVDIGTAGGVERIVRRIIGAALPAVDDDVLLGMPQESDDFYDRYLIAKRRSLTARTYREARAAVDALERLIAERPDFGLAYPPLVRLYNTDFGYTGLGSTGLAERERALELAKAGLAADRGNVHAYTVLGFCHLWHQEHDLGRHYFEQALTLNPYNPARLSEVASGMVYCGDFGRAQALFETSMLLQPFPNDFYCEDRAQLCLLNNQPVGVLGWVRKMSEQRLWSSLYSALCDETPCETRGSSRLSSWRARVANRWVGDQGLTTEELEQWILFHHPLAPEPKATFTELVRRGLQTMESSALPDRSHIPPPNLS